MSPIRCRTRCIHPSPNPHPEQVGAVVAGVAAAGEEAVVAEGGEGVAGGPWSSLPTAGSQVYIYVAPNGCRY